VGQGRRRHRHHLDGHRRERRHHRSGRPAADRETGSILIRSGDSIIIQTGVLLSAGQRIELHADHGKLDAGVASIEIAESVTLTAGTSIEMTATGHIDLTDAVVGAGTSIEMDAGGDLTIDDSELTAGTWIDLDADGHVTVTDSAIDAGTSVKVRAGGHLTAATYSTVDAGSWIELDADTGNIALTLTARTSRRPRRSTDTRAATSSSRTPPPRPAGTSPSTRAGR
jgi:hypothetical protein